MYESKYLETFCSLPMIQLRCIDNTATGQSAGYWLPLKQDWSTRWCTLPQRYMDGWVDRISNFETRESDVFVVTYMKAGTTWMQELTWLLTHNLDFKMAATRNTMERCPYLDFSATNDSLLVNNTVNTTEKLASPRVIKSHLPAQLLPRQLFQKNRKVVYVARNPKDVIVSCFPFVNAIKIWQGDLTTFIDEFLDDKLHYCSFWSHIIDFWRIRNKSNIFFVTYEEMTRDLRGVIKRLCDFLNVNELNECEMNQLLTYLSFNNMKNHESCNPTGILKSTLENVAEDFQFMRRGIVGASKDELNSSQRAKIDKWTETYLKQYGVCESDIFDTV